MGKVLCFPHLILAKTLRIDKPLISKWEDLVWILRAPLQLDPGPDSTYLISLAPVVRWSTQTGESSEGH